MLTRTISGFILASITLGLYALGGWWLFALLYIFLIIAVLEIYWAFRKVNINMSPSAGVFFVAMMPVSIYYFGIKGILGLYMTACILTLIIKVFKADISIETTAFTYFMFFYPCMMMSMLLLIQMTFPYEMGRLGIFVAITTPAITDVFAYFTGYLLGKRKLCPKISPKKTVEGAIGGLLGGVGWCALCGVVLQNILSTTVPFYHFFILGTIIATAAQLGDLSASIIKRSTGIKDFGTIFPGHGGVMDRLDSILFAAPVVYIYFSLLLL